GNGVRWWIVARYLVAIRRAPLGAAVRRRRAARLGNGVGERPCPWRAGWLRHAGLSRLFVSSARGGSNRGHRGGRGFGGHHLDFAVVFGPTLCERPECRISGRPALAGHVRV